MANKRLKDFTGLSGYTNLAADDLVYVADHSSSDGERKVVLSDIKNYVLAGKTVGGAGPGDIVNRDSAQTLTQKTLTSPTINTPVINTPAISAATLTGTTVLPATTSIGTVDATELSCLNGVTSAIQTQLNSLVANSLTIFQATLTAAIEFSQGAGVTTKDITQANLLSALSLSGSTYVIDHTSLIIALHLVQATTWNSVDILDTGEHYSYTAQTINLQEQLDTISFAGLVAEKTYQLTVTLKVLAKTGV